MFLSRDNRYFQDAYQGMPLEGYTPLFERMLDHERIMVCLETEAENVFELEFESNDENAPLSAILIKARRSRGPSSTPGRSTSCSCRVSADCRTAASISCTRRTTSSTCCLAER
mgnify:CR=1 FL=1